MVIQQLYDEFLSVKQSSDTETLLQVFQEQVLRRLKLGGEESEVPARLQKQERVWTKLETDLAKLWTTATKKQGPRLKWWLSQLQGHKLEQKRLAEDLARKWAEEQEQKAWEEQQALEVLEKEAKEQAQKKLAAAEFSAGTEQGIACVCVG